MGKLRLIRTLWQRVAIAGVTGLFVTATATVAFAPPARSATTSVDCSSTSLQSAIDAASSGDTLIVSGTCAGNFVITEELRLEGTATLDGMHAGTTLTVMGGPVEINGLTITNGAAQGDYLLTAGGLYASDNVILAGATSVRDNVGPGIVSEGAIVTLRGSAVVSGNTGGGVVNYSSSTLILNGHSSIRGNADQRAIAGGIFSYESSVIMNDWSSVMNNESRFGAGGVFTFDSRLTLNNHATVSGNSGGAGGIFQERFYVTLNGASSVSGNTGIQGGGIAVADGILTLNGSSSVTGNRAERGGGLWHVGAGEIYLNDYASVKGNRATEKGGGVWNGGCTSEVEPTFTMNDSSVVKNNVAGTTTTQGFGGGIYTYVDPDEPLCTGITNLISGRIVQNRALGGGSGGGVYGPIAYLGPDMTIRRNSPNNCDPAC
jgi:hypothetical protein